MNIRQIVANHLAPLADAIAADVLVSLTGAAPKAPAPAKKAPAPAKAPGRKGPKKAPGRKGPKKVPAKRAPKTASPDTEALALKVAEFVEANPGLGAGGILAGTGLGKGDWSRAAKAALAAGAVRVEGEKRGAKYFPVASA